VSILIGTMFFSAREPRSAGDDIVPSRFLGIGKAASFILLFALLCDARPAAAQFKQLGPKLIGEGSVGRTFRGIAVALSGDGNTAIMGGPSDNSGVGAAWVFTRRGSAWIQQGSKLVGTGGLKPAQQGYAVALSADGNTAILGGFREAWVFTRSGGIWTQQGSTLVGTGAVGDRLASGGLSAALSADGKTAILGADADNSAVGAAWVFSRNDGTWTQQGSKLVGTGSSGPTGQGHSVALSADGNTALIGGYGDSGIGAAWVFTRSGGIWTQQGSKLVGSGAAGRSGQGFSVALSGDGNTALIGGFADDSLNGAAWIFTRKDSVWTQQGSKLVGSGAVGRIVHQGHSVALSADGSTAIVGGVRDAWVFARSGDTWSQLESKLISIDPDINAAQYGLSVALSASGRIAIVGAWTDTLEGGAQVFALPRPHSPEAK
jgi:hypothetical protein